MERDQLNVMAQNLSLFRLWRERDQRLIQINVYRTVSIYTI